MTRLGIVLSGLLLSLAAALPASAQPATILNGIENITMAPIDVAVAPVVAYQTIRGNLELARMGTVGESLSTAIGVPWIWTLQELLAGARIVSGFSEIGLGLALTPVSFFKHVDERQLFDATTASPMVNHQGAFDVVFGSHYVGAR